MAIEFLSERCIRSKGSDGNVVMSSQADQGIELTLLPTSSLKSDQCATSDSGLVLREFFEPEAAVGSLLDNASYQAFNQTAPFEEFKSAMSPIEVLVNPIILNSIYTYTYTCSYLYYGS